MAVLDKAIALDVVEVIVLVVIETLVFSFVVVGSNYI